MNFYGHLSFSDSEPPIYWLYAPLLLLFYFSPFYLFKPEEKNNCSHNLIFLTCVLMQVNLTQNKVCLEAFHLGLHFYNLVTSLQPVFQMYYLTYPYRLHLYVGVTEGLLPLGIPFIFIGREIKKAKKVLYPRMKGFYYVMTHKHTFWHRDLCEIREWEWERESEGGSEGTWQRTHYQN